MYKQGKKQKEIEKIMDNITEEMENIDKILNELGLEEIKFGEKTEEFEKERDEPTNDLSLKEKLNNAEEEGIKNTMKYLKQNSDEMSIRDLDGYFVNEGDLDEEDKDLIDEIKT